MPLIKDGAAAILEAWFPGQAGSRAIVDILMGELNPCGKTTLTFSQCVGAQPSYYNHKFLARGVPQLSDLDPVFPFGHGLSYTEFEYSDLSISETEVPGDGEIQIDCKVKNTGDRAGDEVVQLYVQDLLASVSRPVKELKGFVRISLEPGEAKKVTFVLPVDLLSFMGIDYKRVVEPGAHRVMMGSSSNDIRLEGEFTLTGSVREVGEDRALTSRAVVE
jgi:beta-glucosidase